MVVQQHADQCNDNSPVVQQWTVSEGVCGFAWIVIKPGTSSFARWLVKRELAKAHYYGGVSIWVSLFNQSMERKERYAEAFAHVLRDLYQVTAYAGSRMD